MKYSDVFACSSEGLRNVMRLLSSCPPGLTVKQLEEHVIREILFTDHREKRTASGRCHTHWKTRIYTLLMEAPGLSGRFIRQGIERIFVGLEERHRAEWTSRLWFVPNLPEDLKDSFLKLNHRYFQATAKVKKALDTFLPLWLATAFVSPAFAERDGVFLFSNSDDWKILDQNEKGALLYIGSYYHVRGEAMVVLLPDVSNRGQGCAVEIEPLDKTKTVHQAIAWMYQKDPKKWPGFDSEV